MKIQLASDLHLELLRATWPDEKLVAPVPDQSKLAFLTKSQWRRQPTTKDNQHDNDLVRPGIQITGAALERVECLVENLDSMTAYEISELGPDDCVSGIFIMWLHVQHGIYQRHSKSFLSNARHYLATTGKSIWTALLAGVDMNSRAAIEQFDNQYGVVVVATQF